MIDSFRGVACIMSLRKDKAGDKEVFTISAANKRYLESVNKQDEDFVPNWPYSYYVPADANFEALVRSCIVDGKISHIYVNAGLYNAWLDNYMIPLENDEEGNGYCLFTYEMTIESDSDRLVSISSQTAYMVLKTCIKFRENSDFIVTMNSIVKDIRNQCESDGCAIILMDREKRKIDITCYDHAESDQFELGKDDDVFFKPEFYNIVESWSDTMAGSNCIIISNEEELKSIEKKNPAWYNSLVFSGVKNLVLFPLRIDNALYGYIFATNFNTDKIAFIREVMELNSFILSAEVENFRMRQKLEELSRIDVLTGVLNRNAMSKRVTELENDPGDSPFGLGAIFVDVNGLKKANDTKGHNAGDEMLRNVASKLRSVFPGKEIYRAGGDEFLIIIPDMNRADFYAAFDKLNSVSKIDGEPTFALGAHYEDSDKDISKIMQTADQNMYHNKAEYYTANPHLNRRNR